jgi:hypothetical protein
MLSNSNNNINKDSSDGNNNGYNIIKIDEQPVQQHQLQCRLKVLEQLQLQQQQLLLLHEQPQ